MPTRTWLSRILLVALGLFLTAFLIEIGLRLTGLFFGDRTTMLAAPERHTILTLGDSHTYGVGCSAAMSYPGQLQAQLDRRQPGQYQVINLGLPGTNSSQIRTKLVAWMNQFQPETIVLCVGINNFWNVSAVGTKGGESWIKKALWSSRLVRVIRLILLRFETQNPADPLAKRPKLVRELGEDLKMRVHRDENTGEVLIEHRKTEASGFTESRAVTYLRKDLKLIDEFTAARSVRLILLTYAAFPSQDGEQSFVRQISISDELSKFGNRHLITVVDPRDHFRQLLRRGVPRSRFFLDEHNAHPNARGYHEIAALVASAIEPNIDAPNPNGSADYRSAASKESR